MEVFLFLLSVFILASAFFFFLLYSLQGQLVINRARGGGIISAMNVFYSCRKTQCVERTQYQ